MFTRAITRKPGPNFGDGLTTSTLGPPDYALMSKQHKAYVDTLMVIGLDVTVLEPEPGFPDAHFVEDAAVVFPDVAVISRPGAVSRRGEVGSISETLSKYRTIRRIVSPGTLDGGDILATEDLVFIGISERTNREGARQLGVILDEFGISWTTVPVGEGLHLKSGMNHAGNGVLIVTRKFAESDRISGYEKIVLDDEEAYAANTLLINERLLLPAGFPKTRKKLEKLGLEVIELDMSEVRKMDGGLTCLSIRF